MPARILCLSVPLGKGSQGEMGQDEVMVEVKRLFQRRCRRHLLPQLLEDGGTQVIQLRIELVAYDRFLRPFEGLIELPPVGQDLRQKGSTFAEYEQFDVHGTVIQQA